MSLVYNVQDKPSWGKTLVFALQQLLAILAATIAVPAIIQNGMSPAAALFGAGVGTLVYLLFTKFRSPVFLGSSFAFLGSMTTAFAGAYAVGTAGYVGLVIGAIVAGLVYVALSFIVKFVGTAWIDKVMPAVVIGPTVAIIGLSLAGNAIGDLVTGATWDKDLSAYILTTKGSLSILCGLVTLFTTIVCSVYGKKMLKMIPFICGIGAGYVLASAITGLGWAMDNEALKLVNFEAFKNIEWVPSFTFIKFFGGFKEFASGGAVEGKFWEYFANILVAYAPVAFVVFAEHIADHKNLSSIIGQDLTKDPGLDKTLLGDGVGSAVGAFFGGCPNTTYGESIGCVAISGNASIRTIFVTALMAIVLSFIGPFATFLSTIPSCVMGGVCVALYGFIAVSGLKMIQKVDLGDNRNLFPVSVILIAGIGNFGLSFGGKVTLTKIACALILGILVNVICNLKKSSGAAKDAE